MAQSSARWARWEWSTVKRGRWHRLFADGDLTKTACGSARKNDKHTAVETAGQPTTGKVCETCQWVDQLHDKLVTTTDAVAGHTVPTFTLADILDAQPVTAKVETDPEPVAPAGICGCGCQQSDEARAFRAEHAAWEQRQHETAQAGFAAYLAAQKGPVAA